MGTAATIESTAIVLTIPPTLLGPESPYEQRRLTLKADADRILVEARKVTAVDSPESLEQANNFGRLLQAETKEVELFYKPLKQQVDAFKAPLLAHEKEFAVPVEAEKKRLGGLITAYNQEQERKRQEAERIAHEEADRVAREDALARAVELEAVGDKEGAEQILNEPIQAAPVVIQAEAPVKLAGQVSKMNYSAEVISLMDLVKAVAAGKAKINCVMANESYLNSTARNDKEAFDISGVKLVRTAGTHFRS